MLTNEDKLWIEKAIRDAHEKSDSDHKVDHSEIKEVLRDAVGTMAKWAGMAAVGAGIVLVLVPVSIG